jgi:hypothetical protein
MKFKFFSITIFAILLISLVMPQLVLARGLVPCGGTGEPKCNICHFFQLLQKIISGASISVLALAALFIVIGGIIILSSAGSPDKASEGKRMISYSIIGIVICFGAWIIINTVMNALVSQEKMPWPWNKIQCVPTQTNGGGDGDEEPTGEYCICEVPVYTTAARTMQLFTEIKGTDLNDADTCETNCISDNADAYCPDRATATNPKLYCASQNDLEDKNAFCYKQEATTDSITGACFTNSSTCYNSILSNADYEKKCWLDDQLYCRCTDGLATWCTQSKPSGLYQIAKEVGVGGLFNAWDCTRNCGYSGGYCKTSASETPAEQWCARPAPGGSNVWNLSGINARQKGDASPQLASFLNCMYSRIPGLIITSISSDILCSNPACDITGYDCGHTANSCHFGGTNCAGYSYAVDFGTNISCSSIRDAALACDTSAWVHWETNHTHISVNNTACGCNEGSSGNPCP